MLECRRQQRHHVFLDFHYFYRYSKIGLHAIFLEPFFRLNNGLLKLKFSTVCQQRVKDEKRYFLSPFRKSKITREILDRNTFSIHNYGDMLKGNGLIPCFDKIRFVDTELQSYIRNDYVILSSKMLNIS